MGAQAAYEERREFFAAQAAALDLRHRRVGNLRLLVFFVFAGVAFAARDGGLLSPWWSLLPLAVFVALVFRHRAIEDARERAARGLGFYEDGLARLADRWRGRGATGNAFAPTGGEHRYAADLGLFGEGSLFQALARVTTPYGARALADLLLQDGVEVAEVRDRQQAVAELAPALAVREAIQLASAQPGREFHEGALLRWCGREAVDLATAQRVSAALLAALALSSLGLWAGVVPPIVPLLLIFAQGLLIRRVRARAAASVHAGDEALEELGDLEALLAALDGVAVEARLLKRWQQELSVADGVSARAALRSLRRRFELHESGHNLFFTPLAFLLGWEIHTIAAVERWRADHGARAAGWLSAVGGLEALLSLACRSFERPEEIFPEVVDADGPAFLEAKGLAHPLLPAAEVVGNDVSLGQGSPALLVVSGSNMSGKSTLLRTLGISVVLAQAGGPVRAAALRLTPLLLGASIRTEDSLLDHRSRFQAEIERLAALLRAAEGEHRLLFLLDELLAGTNSHDRRLGAAGLLAGFLDRNAIGAVTTHDLALAQIADELGESARNVHFEDRFEDGRLRFDFRLREGVVTRSNALDLMRAVGLPVSD